MKLFLTKLKELHPLLPDATAQEYSHRAAIGLDRHRHEQGVLLATLCDKNSAQCTLHWTPSASGDDAFLDFNRVTEDAAEAIALALTHAVRGWVVKRRLQRGEFADWLLVDSNQKYVALEISGTDDGDMDARLAEKKEQVSKADGVQYRVACVVELASPRAAVESV